MADLNEMITQQRICSYEISIWTLQDRFLSVLKWLTMDQKGQIQEPEMVLRDDGTEELSFTIPKFYYSGAQRVQNPMWLHLKNQPLEANMHKLKVIFNKNTEDERVFEFLVVSVAQDHVQDRVDINVKAEGLAFHELGKVGYKIAFSQETYELAVENWANHSMRGDKPCMNIQYWNDLIFKDSDGNWRTNWQYEVRMDWSSYSHGASNEKDPSCVYEDEYVSSWQLDTNNKLVPNYTEGYKEKWRPVEVSDSNIYNATQTIAEQFGVFCRYEYEHDENYQIIGKKVIYYNNYIYDKEGHIDLTYPYSSSSITRTVDNSNITTKMFVSQVEENDNTISIMDVDANKSREDYLLCFDYLKDIQGINEDQYQAIQDYEAKMHQLNTSLSAVQERIRILSNQLVQLEADYTTYNNAYALDNERYEEAKKGLNSITGGQQLIPVDTNFVVMEDNENGLGLYIRMRFEGMQLSSIKLYAKSNFASLNGTQYSEPVLFSPRFDDSGELTHLYNLQKQDLKAGDTVYLSGMRDPYSYYTKLMDLWGQRKAADEEKRDKANETATLYKWYLHGSRVGYGFVGSIYLGQEYLGLLTTAPFEGSLTELEAYSLTHPYVSWYVGRGRVGEAGETYDYDNEYDHFSEMDIAEESADLYYLADYLLRLKEIEYNKFERMLGAALREGYWTPEDYHDHGDSYEASLRISAKAEGSLEANNFTYFIPGSQVWAMSPDNKLAPHLQLIWDCNKYYDNEEALIYTSSVAGNCDQHLIIDISNYLNIVKEHLDDLCFFYYALPNVKTIEDIGKTNQSGTKLYAITADLEKFTRGRYDIDNKQVGTNYYSKLKYFINKLSSPNNIPIDESYSQTLQDLKSELSTGISALKNAVNSLSNVYYTNLTEEQTEILTKIANAIYDTIQQYTKIKNRTSVKNLLDFVNTELKWLDAAYSYLVEADQTIVSDWNQIISEPSSNGSYSKEDCGLIIFIKQYQMYNDWLKSLKKDPYYSFQVNSQAELGWVLDTDIKFNSAGRVTGYGNRKRFPAFIVTGAKTLDAETIRFITTGTYTTIDAQGHSINHTTSDYKPFLGYYETVENEDGTTALVAKTLKILLPEDFIGTDTTCTENCTRNLVKHDYDKTGNPRQPKASEYRYQRVYPRLFFDTLKLKESSSDLYINVNNITLDSFKDYYLVTDDRSIGQKTYGIGYYLTLKPNILFQYGSNTAVLDISYSLSNSDVAIYLDALKVMRENAYPKVSYEVELSILNPEFIKTAYNRLNQIVHINDNDLQLEEASGYISTVTLKLDKPWEDTVEIKNYTTKFEDLFTTIVAQTEAMKKSSQGLDTALQAFSRTTGLIDSDVLYNSMLNANLNLSFNKGTLTIDQTEGIWGTSEDGVVAFRGGGIFTATQHDADGNWIWNTGILPSGINASLITTGQLDTNKIKVYAGDQLRFQLNGEGLYAYKPFTAESEDVQRADGYDATSNVDSKQYVVFNSEGLFLTAEAGAAYPKTIQINSSTGAIGYSYATLDAEVKRVEVSWKGLILRNWEGENVFYADNNGNLTLKGEIQATSGDIAGWKIDKDALYKGSLALYSGPQDSDIGIALNPTGVNNRTTTDSNGTVYYIYTSGGKTYYRTTSARETVTVNSGDKIYEKDTRATGVVRPRYTQVDQISELDTSSTKYDGTSDTNNSITLVESTSASTVITIYVMKSAAKNDYAYYNGAKIAYGNNQDNENATWYKQLKAAYSNYEDYIVIEEEEYFKEITLTSSMTLEPAGEAGETFHVYADDGDVKILKGTIGNFILSNDGLKGGTITGTKFNVDNTSNNVKFGHFIYDVDATTGSAAGKVYLKRVDGSTVNFNIAAMKAYQDAVAAAASLTLKLTVNGTEVTAVANTAGGQTITKKYTLGSSGGKVEAIATNGLGLSMRQQVTIDAYGQYSTDSAAENTGICENCEHTCFRSCAKVCDKSNGGGTSGKPITEDCQVNCIGHCAVSCTAGCGGVCAHSCISSCKGSCEESCYGGCLTGCLQSCTGQCKYSCTGSCSGTCTNGCINECKGTCKGSCLSSCTNGCEGMSWYD